MDIDSVVTDTLRSIALFLPKALGFVAILVVGWLTARALRMLAAKFLERIGFDRLVERGGLSSALAHTRVDASDLVAKLVFYAVLLFTLQLAFGIWGPNPVSDLIYSIVTWLPKAFVAIVIVVIAAAIGSWVRDLIAGALAGLSYGRLLARLAWVFIIGLGIIAALNQIDVATTVTTPILIAVLATIGGILIVGVGGGLVRPMQGRWEEWLQRAQQESSTVAEHARAYAAEQAEAAAMAVPAERVSASAAVPTQPAVPTQYRSASVPVPTPAPTPAASAPESAMAAPTQQLRKPGRKPTRTAEATRPMETDAVRPTGGGEPAAGGASTSEE
ncbi:hypothetical protein F4553_007657 [Allocatelliglobosispora scoriae]|uniref:Uncharacterized protein n=1 Tax=Allocatelliglobosispora scoriae TaxID=643052 RepID=A0A841C503_9ACTN|nr:hypothetical protein [Allocatelliglobosispora scoriae]MBB5874223.1 hypothetical protein [Allocatelliglobosispora scoriae]